MNKVYDFKYTVAWAPSEYFDSPDVVVDYTVTSIVDCSYEHVGWECGAVTDSMVEKAEVPWMVAVVSPCDVPSGDHRWAGDHDDDDETNSAASYGLTALITLAAEG